MTRARGPAGIDAADAFFAIFGMRRMTPEEARAEGDHENAALLAGTLPEDPAEGTGPAPAPARGRRSRPDQGASSVQVARTVVRSGSTKTSAPEALDLAEEEAPGAEEARMVSEATERGKRSGHGARARRRAEQAIADGRRPGKPGPKADPAKVEARVEEAARSLAGQPEALGSVLRRVFAKLADDPRALAVLLPESEDLR